MSQRLMKLVLPSSEQETAKNILNQLEDSLYWQEESSKQSYIVSILIPSEQTENLMDQFETNFGKNEQFHLVVFPVEASIPRLVEKDAQSAKKKLSRISREEMYHDIVDSTELSLNYLLMVLLSTVVVVLGLQQNSVAVIIGGMVIAPFLGPNVALALASCIFDKQLGINAIKTSTAGFFLVVVIAGVVGFFMGVNVELSEIKARTHVSIPDLLLAIASGCAGVLAFTTGASSAVIGVMVAVALLPPLTVFGLMLGAGHFIEASGALALFIANIICINFSGIITLYLQGVTPNNWYHANKAEKTTQIAFLIWSLLLIVLFIAILLL